MDEPQSVVGKTEILFCRELSADRQTRSLVAVLTELSWLLCQDRRLLHVTFSSEWKKSCVLAIRSVKLAEVMVYSLFVNLLVVLTMSGFLEIHTWVAEMCDTEVMLFGITH